MNREFYLYEGELWCKDDEGRNYLVDQSHGDLLDDILTRIRDCYPEAYRALQERYRDSAPNKVYYRYVMVRRFLKCNFAQLDSTSYDIEDEKMNFERVDCPLRLECRYDGIICSPMFKTSLSAAEMRVGRLLYKGMTKDEIAGMLYLSPETVNCHVRSIFHKLGIHDKASFVRYANDKDIFK